MSLKILFLDDMASRRRVAQQWFGGEHDIHYAKNAGECLGMYLLHQNSSEPFDLVSLDHDLGERWDGRHVVDGILLLHDRLTLPKPTFAIHSWNVPRAQEMWFRLKDAGFKASQAVFAPPAYLDSLDDEDVKP